LVWACLLALVLPQRAGSPPGCPRKRKEFHVRFRSINKAAQRDLRVVAFRRITLRWAQRWAFGCLLTASFFVPDRRPKGPQRLPRTSSQPQSIAGFQGSTASRQKNGIISNTLDVFRTKTAEKSELYGASTSPITLRSRPFEQARGQLLWAAEAGFSHERPPLAGQTEDNLKKNRQKAVRRENEVKVNVAEPAPMAASLGESTCGFFGGAANTTQL